ESYIFGNYSFFLSSKQGETSVNLEKQYDLIGDGISSAKGDVHKRQRKMMSPSFSFANVKEMLPILVHAAYNLRDIWIKQIGDKNEEIITITDIISNITLDIIGILGFNYEFNSTTTDSELARAYRSALVFNPLLVFISDLFPVIRKIPYFNRNKDSIKTIHNISEKLVTEQKNSTVRGKDFLSLLIQANEKLPDDEKLTHHELVSQVMTLLLAGHETTSTALTWSLYYLAKNPDVQDNLRKEILEIFSDRNHFPTFDEIDRMKLAHLEIKTVLAIIIRNLKFRLVEGFTFETLTTGFSKPHPRMDLFVSKVDY
ncbi:4047_t:CDS:2, partial [Racocetra fulgida]